MSIYLSSALHFPYLVLCKTTDVTEASNFRYFIEEFYETQPSEIDLASRRKCCFGEMMFFHLFTFAVIHLRD